MDNKYCVYVHKDSDSIIRYVGSGTIARANTRSARSGRGSDYEKFVESNGKLTVEIIKTSLTKQESLSHELELYAKYQKDNTLLNKKKPNVNNILIGEEVFYQLEYSESSRSGLIWTVDRRNVKTGSSAGCCGSGRYQVQINGRLYYNHRIIYSMFNRDICIENLVIDHIDGNPLNNSIKNLRAVTSDVNSRNRSRHHRKDSSIPTGVCFDTRNNMFIAQVSDPSTQYENGVNKVVQRCFTLKQFATSPDPYEAAKQAAVSARIEMLKELNNRLNLGYTEDHGT